MVDAIDGSLGLNKITATEFAKLWKSFDINQSGYMEGNELNSFFYDLAKDLLKKEPSEDEHNSVKTLFMAVYDKAKDGRISMNELAKMLLPEDEEFLLFFRRRIPLNSSVTFMQIWRRYDKNRSGFLNKAELRNFVSDYITASGCESVTADQVDEYTSSIMALFDLNSDGLLTLQDMARLVNVSKNFLLQFRIEDGSAEQRKQDFEKIFQHYDQSNTGALEGVEVDGFVKDMMETIRGPLTASELDDVKASVLNHCDVNGDGKIQKSELAVCLSVHI
nr:secretagogin-like [Ciona intestinalis]|eukprot:XP_002127141.1 secretagogin-like [Ciona intestinalis]